MNHTGHYVQQHGLDVDTSLYDFVNDEVIPGTGIDVAAFWQQLSKIVEDLSLENRALLSRRDKLQQQIDQWHRTHAFNPDAYRQFLEDIGYLEPEGHDFAISPSNVDEEITTVAGPQLVVPVNNARFAVNAANARWGSLYDAVYGSDLLSEFPASCQGGLDPARARAVIAWVSRFLDDVVPLKNACYADITGFRVDDHALLIHTHAGATRLSEPGVFAGYRGHPLAPELVLLRHNNLHIEIHIDHTSPVARLGAAGISDVRMEAAVTAIQDCEDSVAAVDAADKVQVYRNWLGLMRGTLSANLHKHGTPIRRMLNPDHTYQSPAGETICLPGRALMMVRNVGIHMTTPAILDAKGMPVYEGIIDAMVTSLIALHDLKGNGRHRNSRAGSIYIVKPKLHGPDEVSFTVNLFERVEQALGLNTGTIKIGLMDEERRTSLNLKACIHRARDRLVFINTGFLDRTGDEIHTSMHAGAMAPKAMIQQQGWLRAYEDQNVDIGLQCGMQHHAQIGKGMWAMPDALAHMVEKKITHPAAGANCAWVPSPTAAILHAVHYHQVDVHERQRQLSGHPRTTRNDLLQPPLIDKSTLSDDIIRDELENNCQGILGYVVRWINQGIGCSKVPDIHNIGLMEDRATLRISSQHIANWLLHSVVSAQQVNDTLCKMALVVDRQNSGDRCYKTLAPDCNGIAFETAMRLIFEGLDSPNGYTEFILQQQRLKVKQGRRRLAA